MRSPAQIIFLRFKCDLYDVIVARKTGGSYGACAQIMDRATNRWLLTKPVDFFPDRGCVTMRTPAQIIFL